MTHNPENERIKRKYFAYLQDAKQYSEATVDAVAKALSRFEKYTRHRPFKNFHIEQAMAFKRSLAEQCNLRSGEKLSKATLYATLSHLAKFFFWLAQQPGYRSRMLCSHSEYFNLSAKETRIATAQRERTPPTMEQIKHVIEVMPTGDEIERRDRALIAFTLLTGARDSAIASMKLKHVDLIAECIHQDAREVKTKASKSFVTYFFPVGDEIKQIVVDWIQYLTKEKLWGGNDPLFPATQINLGETAQFAVVGLKRSHWSDSSPIRRIFKAAFERAGLPYFHPHSFRKTLARLGEQVCKTPEEFKSWSQNMGHEKVMTTFNSYGKVAPERQGDLIRGLSLKKPEPSDAQSILRALSDAGLKLSLVQ